MNTKNFLIGGIVGGVVYFLLGWLVYGNLLADIFSKNVGSATGVNRTMDQFQWWALVLGNMVSGFLLAYVFAKANITTASSGLVTGGVLGLLMGAAFDFTMYATTNLMNLTGTCIDIIAFTVLSAITGAVVAAVMGRSNRASVTTNAV